MAMSACEGQGHLAAINSHLPNGLHSYELLCHFQWVLKCLAHRAMVVRLIVTLLHKLKMIGQPFKHVWSKTCKLWSVGRGKVQDVFRTVNNFVGYYSQA